MEIFKCYVPRQDYAKAKDLSILIYNKERKKYPELTNAKVKRNLAEHIRYLVALNNGTKPLVEILTEYYNKLKKEG